MKIVGVILLLAATAVAGFGAYQVVGLRSEVTSLEARLEHQRQRKDEVVAEMADLDRRIQDVGKEMLAVPDSLRTPMQGYAMKKGEALGKEKFALENRKERMWEGIRRQETRVEEARGHLRRALMIYAGVTVTCLMAAGVAIKLG